jgi:hypothetical protein
MNPDHIESRSGSHKIATVLEQMLNLMQMCITKLEKKHPGLGGLIDKLMSLNEV